MKSEDMMPGNRLARWASGACVALVMAAASAQAAEMTCESDNGQWKRCSLPGSDKMGVELIRQLSRAECNRDYTWGADSDGIWVDKGCRAVFAYRGGSGWGSGGGQGARAEIVLYENDNYNGRTFRATGNVSNLDNTGFNDKASSVIVRGGEWQLCGDADYRGNCVTLGPGEYPSLRSMNMNDKVSSLREQDRSQGGWGAAPGGSGPASLGGDVYSPQQGIVCDRRAGFCADASGISLGYTKEYLGDAAQNRMMKRIDDAGANNYDLTWFTLSNGVECKTRQRACYESKGSDRVDRDTTRALFR